MERFKEPKPKTLDDEKEELELSMKSSRHQEYVRKEMDKIRKEGKIKDDSFCDSAKIISPISRWL